VWEALCDQLWQGRYVREDFVALREGGQPREAYLESLADASRTLITRNELLKMVWSFRFKAAAGVAWQLGDPWWQGGEASRVRFYADGAAVFVTGGPELEEGRPVLSWKFVRFGQGYLDKLDEQAHATTQEGRFSKFGERGVRAKVMGREVPTYCVRRNLQNWGWTMESCWVLWTSWPMPPRGSAGAAELDDERLPVTFNVQRMEALQYNFFMREDSDDGDAEDAPVLEADGVLDAVVDALGAGEAAQDSFDSDSIAGTEEGDSQQ